MICEAKKLLSTGGETMLRRILLVGAAIVVVCWCLGGCKGKSGTEPNQETVKSKAEYEAEAKKEITKENAGAELDKIEKELDQEAAQQ